MTTLEKILCFVFVAIFALLAGQTFETLAYTKASIEGVLR